MVQEKVEHNLGKLESGSSGGGMELTKGEGSSSTLRRLEGCQLNHAGRS